MVTIGESADRRGRQLRKSTGRKLAASGRWIAAIAAIVALAACGDSTPATTGGDTSADTSPSTSSASTATSSSSTERTATGDLLEMTVLLPNPNLINYPELIGGIEQGYFEERGLDVQLQVAVGGESLAQAISAGRGDVVLSATSTFLDFAAEGGEPVFFYLSTPRNVFDIYVPVESEIEAPADLAGATIGVPDESGIEAIIASLIAAVAGVTEDEFDFLAIGEGGAAVPALERGDIDGYTGAPADAAILRARGFELRPLAPPEFHDRSGVGFFTTRSYYEDHREALQNLVDGMHLGYEWAVENPDAFLDGVGNHSPESVEDREMAVELRETVFTELHTKPEPDKPLGYVSPRLVESWHETRVNAGDEPVENLESYYTNEFFE